MDERTSVRIAGRTLAVTNLDKVLYPSAGTTKAELIRYYVGVAEVVLPHLVGRPVTFKRYPDGVDHDGFFEKRCPDHRPDWVPTVALPKRADGDADTTEMLEHCELSEVAALVWAANLAALELHVPMGRSPDPLRPTAVVFDLDPGAPADVVSCATVALRLRELFERLDLVACVKTSGAKGLQVYVPAGGATTSQQARDFAHAVAQLLERAEPDLVVSVQTRAERVGRVLIDWTQNHPIKTTIGVYSPRARSRPTVSTPLAWDEVSDLHDAGDPDAFAFELDDVVRRVTRVGDLFAPVVEIDQELPVLAPPSGDGA